MPDTILHYKVVELLGEGARSTIYSVIDQQSKKAYALKHVLRKDPKDIRFIEQMETEFELSRKFNHPNLRRSYELKLVKSILMKVTEAFLIMELCEGKPLDVRPPSNMMSVMDIFIQAAQGLKAMHQLGYIHCDIKPNNILSNDFGAVKVIDYGQSCPIGTVKERIQGTPDFIAPEQVARKPVGVQTDVFNLGATLYWACTGKHIPTLYTVNKKGENSFLLDDRIDSPSDLNPKVPTSVSNLITEMIATKLQKRPADMDEVITRLELGKHILNKQAVGTANMPPTSVPLDSDSVDV
ncbi:MAG: serine/threonine protein kinase [Phycisphaerae bacterium]|nr:serine/threonine protein kinase [Phycisphaerae bacterium]